MGMVLIGLFFILLNSAQSSESKWLPTQESECQSVDLRQTFPLKIRDQHKISWCFAHTSADALQYAFQIPEQISAADIAINYSKSKWSRFLHFFKRIFDQNARREPAQTGLMKYATQMILPQGYCPESALPSETWTKVERTGEKSEVEIVKAALEIFDLQKKIKKQIIPSAEALPFFYEFKKIDQNQFYFLLKNYSQRKLLEQIRVTACNGERKPFPGALGMKMKFLSKHMFRDINQSFDQNMPVSIDFFSWILKNIDDPLNITRAYHTVLLYGRKFDPAQNECRYLIKNSYGSSCDGYDPRLSCEQGYLWIPESTLRRTMSSIVLFKNH